MCSRRILYIYQSQLHRRAATCVQNIFVARKVYYLLRAKVVYDENVGSKFDFEMSNVILFTSLNYSTNCVLLGYLHDAPCVVHLYIYIHIYCVCVCVIIIQYNTILWIVPYIHGGGHVTRIYHLVFTEGTRREAFC